MGKVGVRCSFSNGSSSYVNLSNVRNNKVKRSQCVLENGKMLDHDENSHLLSIKTSVVHVDIIISATREQSRSTTSKG